MRFFDRFKRKKKKSIKIYDRLMYKRMTNKMGTVTGKFGSDKVPLYKKGKKYYRPTFFGRDTYVPYKGKIEKLTDDDF